MNEGFDFTPMSKVQFNGSHTLPLSDSVTRKTSYQQPTLVGRLKKVDIRVLFKKEPASTVPGSWSPDLVRCNDPGNRRISVKLKTVDQIIREYH